MARNAAILVNTSLLANSTITSTVQWDGGRGTLVLSANQYAGHVFLQTQSAMGKWISINGTTYSTDQVTAYDLPKGQYRMVSSAGSSVAFSATLVPIAYGG